VTEAETPAQLSAMAMQPLWNDRLPPTPAVPLGESEIGNRRLYSGAVPKLLEAAQTWKEQVRAGNLPRKLA
jgi:hypothetical protein